MSASVLNTSVRFEEINFNVAFSEEFLFAGNELIGHSEAPSSCEPVVIFRILNH